MKGLLKAQREGGERMSTDEGVEVVESGIAVDGNSQRHLRLKMHDRADILSQNGYGT